MSFKCEVCGATFKTKTGPTSSNHLKSQIHLNAGQRPQKPPGGKREIEQPKGADTEQSSRQIKETVLFLALQHLQQPTYSNLLAFFASFGIRNEEAVNVLFQKLKDGDVAYPVPQDPALRLIYQNLMKLPKISYPITVTVQDAWTWVKDLGVATMAEVVTTFRNLAKKYPDFAVLSPSKLGGIEDLITIKRVFPEDVRFTLANRWRA